MFYFSADVTIESALSLADLGATLSNVLSILPMKLDTSGRYEGDEVYETRSFGLVCELAQDDPPLTTYHLTVNSDVDRFDFDGSEQEIDGTNYVLSLLGRG